MAIAFSRSLRSLQADNWRATLLSLLLAMLLISLWCGWFFFAAVHFTANGQVLGVDENGLLLGDFSALSQQQFAQLKRGQLVSIKLPDQKLVNQANSTAQASTLQASIVQLTGADLALQHVRLALLRQQAYTDLTALQQASLDVLLEQISPAQFLLRHIGLSHSE